MRQVEVKPMLRRELRAMNSDIELVCYGADAEHLLDLAERWLAAYENRYSRFRVLSELSRLNATAGHPFYASLGLYRLVELALTLAKRSGGVFDPTILASLQNAGYDRSFELLPADRKQTEADAPRPGWRDVQLNPVKRTIILPEGVGIDLGGIGKGWAVDRLAAILGKPCLINGGGDVYAGGKPQGEASWRIGVANPFHPESDLLVLGVCNRGVATSSSMRRRWQSDGIWLHHLIDPRTGRSSTSDAVQVTAVALTTALADYHAKVALLMGSEAGLIYLDMQRDVEGLIVTKDGKQLTTEGFGDLVI